MNRPQRGLRLAAEGSGSGRARRCCKSCGAGPRLWRTGVFSARAFFHISQLLRLPLERYVWDRDKLHGPVHAILDAKHGQRTVSARLCEVPRSDM